MISMLQDARLKRLQDKISILKNATGITSLPGGLTNLNYRVDTPDGSYMMRLSNPKTSLLGINRTNERINTARASIAGVGPSVIDFVAGEGILIVSWIEAKTLHASDLQLQSSLIPRIAAALRLLHMGTPFKGEFYFPAVRQKYLQTVLDNNYFLPEQYLSLSPLIMELESIMAANPEPLVPCNNDLLAENFMDDGTKIWIIDYEYAGQNEASFEIGNLAAETDLDDTLLTSLCDHYWGQHLPEKIARAIAWSMIARYGWLLWASIQEASSSLEFDFRGWGLKKWHSVLPELNGERYTNVLQKLKEYQA